MGMLIAGSQHLLKLNLFFMLLMPTDEVCIYIHKRVTKMRK